MKTVIVSHIIYLMNKGGGVSSEPKNLRPWTEVISPELYEQEFWEMAQGLQFTDRNPLNTEMFFLWCLVKSSPIINLYESGTFQGYSAEILAKAIATKPINFTTIGLSLDDSYDFARNRLKGFSNVSVVEGNSVEWVKQQEKSNDRCGWWIDGPKGKNMLPLFDAIGEKYESVEWIAVHDAEPEDWSGNRKRTINYFSDTVPISFTEESFQKKYSYMDKPLIGKSSIEPWYPHKQRGLEDTSYGTQTIIVWTEGRKWSDLVR